MDLRGGDAAGAVGDFYGVDVVYACLLAQVKQVAREGARCANPTIAVIWGIFV